MSAPTVLRPRMLARIYVPNVGSPSDRVQQENVDDVTELAVRVHRARWECNNHLEADEVELDGTYDDLGIDPRFLRSAEVYFHLGHDATGNFTPTVDNLRFVGIATDVERHLSESSGMGVRIRALDYTTLFLTAKHFPPDGVPDYSQTLPDAWSRICDHTGYVDFETKSVVSTVQRLRDRIDFVGVDPGIVIGTAVSSRLRKLGKLQVPHDASAWTVWQTAVGSLGLISFIRGDRCIVTTATDYYTGDDPPRFIWGRNVLELRERRDVQAVSGKNVGIFSLNPLTGQVVEAYWPPLEDVKKQKRLGASALGPSIAVRAQDYEIFPCPMPITEPSVLEEFAHRVWEERTRQELAGTMHVREMFADTLSGKSFDLLALGSGDRIRVEIARAALTLVQRIPSISGRIEAMKSLGYSDDMAKFVVKNLDAITRVTPEFQVHRTETTLDVTDPDSGSYDMVVEYVNRIETSGSANPGTGIGTPQMTGQSSDR